MLLRVDARYAGSQGMCPSCHGPISIPSVAEVSGVRHRGCFALEVHSRKEAIAHQEQEGVIDGEEKSRARRHDIR
jgi:hypothetical protein